MEKITKSLIVGAVLGTSLVCGSQAALILSESFNYTVGGTLSNVDGAGTDANGGTGFSGAWNNSRTDSIVTGLTDSRSATSGGGIGGAALVSVNTTGRVWDGTSYGDDGEVTWFSIIMSSASATYTATTAPGSRMMLFSNGPNMGSSNGFGFELGGVSGGIGNISARLGGTVSSTTATYIQDTANFVLGRYVNSASGNDLVEIWVNPNATALSNYSISGNLVDLGTASSSVSLLNAAVTFSASSGVYLRAGGTNSVWTADELYVGTAFSDVVTVIPEPSTSALLALGIAGLVVLRRRNPSIR